jgi:poly(A) polymerase
LKPFGSNFFQADDSASDFDILIVSYQSLMNRYQFTDDLVQFLVKHGGSDVSNIYAIPLAKVPIIKLEYKGVSMDLLYSAMLDPKPSPQSVDTPFNSDAWLCNIANCGFDQANYFSYNGWLSCKSLYEMIEDTRIFIPALRTIKLWVKQRGLYGFNFGYLNGISLVVMLIKV